MQLPRKHLRLRTQGSVYRLAPRPARDGEDCGDVGCWSRPRVVVRSVSNPRSLAVAPAPLHQLCVTGRVLAVRRRTPRARTVEPLLLVALEHSTRPAFAVPTC